MRKQAFFTTFIKNYVALYQAKKIIMNGYTDTELENLLFDLESDLVERKRSPADRSSIRRNICAFANDLPGHGKPGVIFIGVEDDGRCANLEITDQMLQILAQMRSDGNILPLPTMTVEKRTIADCELIVITVAPSRETPVRYKGRVFVKVGPTVRPASSEEERRLSEKRRAADLPFDMRQAAGATLNDLDIDYIEAQYLPRAVAPDVLEANTRPLEHQLYALRLLHDGRPTNGALIAFARDPQIWIPGAYVQFLRLDGKTITDPILDQKDLTGKLEDILNRLDELLEINISVRTDIKSVSREQRYPDYPIVALQQLARNAIMHRAYEGTNAPVRVYWFSDRIEIQNPGGLYGQVNEQNFGTGITDYRNPLIAEIMHHLGFAQRFGLGIPLARQELEKNGNPPAKFLVEATHFTVIIRAAK